MRKINRVILHCSATPRGRDVSAAEIRRWHVENNRWRDIGYHWVVRLDGTIEAGRPEFQIGAHAAGHNTDSIGICYVGGLHPDGGAEDTRTPAQIEAVDRLIDYIRQRYGNNITVHGHNEFSNRACPSYSVAEDRAARRR